MRIVDQIDHPVMRISIFQMNQKYMLKFEWGPLEQVYKFNEDDFKDLADFKAQASSAEYHAFCMQRFIDMKAGLEFFDF